MALVGTVTQTKDGYGLLIVTTTGLTGTGNTTPPFLSQGYPYGSVHLVANGTTTSDVVAIQGSNDGVNFVTLASFTASAANAMLPLNVPATSDAIPAPAKFYQFLLTGTAGATYALTTVLMGTRG